MLNINILQYNNTNQTIYHLIYSIQVKKHSQQQPVFHSSGQAMPMSGYKLIIWLPVTSIDANTNCVVHWHIKYNTLQCDKEIE